jgi:hypothetical protein
MAYFSIFLSSSEEKEMKIICYGIERLNDLRLLRQLQS